MTKEDIVKHRFKPGESGNPAGKPVGAVSVKARLKRMFRENPDKFEEFIQRYLKNPNNEKHLTGMLDDKPAQAIQLDAEVNNNIELTDEQLERIIAKRRE